MSEQKPRPRGLYFEELELGKRIVTAGRTITETDIVMFAGLSGDYNQIHTDAEYSRATAIGQRMAHGLLGLSIASGLAVQTGFMEGTVLLFREVREWKFLKPIFIGDTVHAEVEVTERKDLRRTGSGLVILSVELRNQRQESVMKGIWEILVAARPPAEPS